MNSSRKILRLRLPAKPSSAIVRSTQRLWITADKPVEIKDVLGSPLEQLNQMPNLNTIEPSTDKISRRADAEESAERRVDRGMSNRCTVAVRSTGLTDETVLDKSVSDRSCTLWLTARMMTPATVRRRPRRSHLMSHSPQYFNVATDWEMTCWSPPAPMEISHKNRCREPETWPHAEEISRTEPSDLLSQKYKWTPPIPQFKRNMAGEGRGDFQYSSSTVSG